MSYSRAYRQRYPEIECHYELQETLGSGGFAKVKAAVHKLTGEKVAIKIMDKHQLGADLPRVYREIRALRKLHHQHVCQMFQIVETDKMIHLVLEFCSGGELFDYIVAKERLKEKEARSFFRQILSALYYVHQMGFIHRDLKPENLLLDEDSNIKLIDFGLVAEPDDTTELLETCCGSPAYAAPELIRGGPYIGPQADVWSLGVLLYALLNGFLPFDDDYTPRLYQMIQKGDYELPEWLSPSSIRILARLLQTDPSRRATVENLLRDPWVMKDFETTVLWQSKIELDRLDDDCVEEFARYKQISKEEMEEKILKWKYDDVTATYLLLLQQKLRGKTPTMSLPQRKPTHSSGDAMSPSPLTAGVKISNGSISTGSVEVNSHNKSSSDEESFHTPGSESPILHVESNGTSQDDTPVFSPAPATERTRRISLGQPMHPPKGELLTLAKPEKLMHPAVSTIRDEDEGEPIMPSTPLRFPLSSSMQLDEFQMSKNPVKKTMSYESRLQFAVEDQRRATVAVATPQRRKKLGSLEYIFKKAKKVIVRKGQSDSNGPRKVKGIYDISTTSTKSADEVINEIESVLQQFSIQYLKNGYLLQCSVPSYKESTSHKKEKVKVIKFDLEICLLPRLDMLGVRRKRIKGDLWEFKKVCDQIFKATHL